MQMWFFQLMPLSIIHSFFPLQKIFSDVSIINSKLIEESYFQGHLKPGFSLGTLLGSAVARAASIASSTPVMCRALTSNQLAAPKMHIILLINALHTYLTHTHPFIFHPHL